MQYAEYTQEGRFVTDDSRVKIGRSRDPSKRKLDLEVCQDFYIKIAATFPGCGDKEAEVHRALSSHRSVRGAGVEWFSLSAEEALAKMEAVLGVEATLDAADLKLRPSPPG
jgi:hypothetical protein